jgi:2',3'-cyclic-nucleotide 2'-phosphodiesterase (5'-nucleotidase family)/predicted extracellular nuclease
MRRRMSLLLVMSLIASLLPSLALTAAAVEAEETGPDVVISQVYGGGGNSGATYTHDYVELFNRGDSSASLAGKSLQYGSATGNFGSSAGLITALDGSVPPGGYFLVQMASGGAVGDALPTADQTSGTNLAAANGKIVLVEQTTALGCGADATPCSAEQLEPVLDLVGYGTANTYEGTAAAPAGSNTTAIFRAANGCTDTDDNAADFSAATPAPRNSSSPLNPCGEPINQPIQTTCADLSVDEGEGGSSQVSATDPDGIVVSAEITDGAVDGISLQNIVPAAEEGGTLTADLVVADTLEAGRYDVTITFTNDDDEVQTETCSVLVAVYGDQCAAPDEDLTLINEIQGSDATTPIAGERVVTRGVVTADFTSGGESGIPDNQGYRGFFIEAIEDDRDEDAQTSEGLFIFEPAGTFDGEIGDLVYVQGVAGEGPATGGQSVTQVTADDIDTCTDTGLDTDLPPPAELPLPVAPADRASVLEPLESMRVTHSELSVVEFFQLERFGEVRLSSGGVLQNPTNVVDPRDDDAYNGILDYNRANNIILDDGRTGSNIDNEFGTAGQHPQPYLVPGDTLRIGDQLRDHTMVLHYGFSNWRLQPIDVDAITEELRTNRTRPRPAMPDVGGSLTIASFNVLNYFNGDGYFVGDDAETAEGFPTARGAVTPSEFERQTAKIVSAIVAMDADVLGLIEMENDGGERQATAALVDAINTELEDDVYDYLDTGVVGGDAIKMAYIYKPETVELAGEPAILDSSVDPRFEDDRSRPVIAQTFKEIASGESVTVAVNHLKSKGSACLPADNDGRQGNCNGVRLRAAQAMADWLAENPTEQEDAVGTLIIGDINAYAKEDPIVALLDAGYTDLLEEFSTGEMPYTYTFDATQGYLDHALADEGALPHVTGAAAWNINADEVPAIDYLESKEGDVSFNRRFRTEETAAAYFEPHEFRSSDHDPVLVGLQLGPPPVEVKLLATNDFHGRLKPPSGGLGGAAFLATHLDAIRAENPGALYVDAGDLVGATPVLSNLFYDEPTVEVMNLLGLDVQTVGNHEFDRGQSDVLRRRDGGCFGDDCDYRGGTPFEGQDFVTLSSNVVYTESGEALTLDRYVVEVDGIDVGFVGVTTKNTPNVVKPTGIEGLTFLDEAEAVNATVEDLEADGADVIVVLMHEGARQNVANPDPNECVDLSGAAVNIIDGFSDAVDVVVTGHTHQSYVCDLEDGPLVTQAFEYGKRFTEITLEVDALTGEVLTREAVNHDVTQDVEPDADVLALIAHYDELAGPALREVVGTSQVPIPRTTRLRESAQGNLATDALVDQYEEIDFAFQNSGGLRADLTRPAEAVDPPQLDGDGNYNIARENVLAVWPFGNIVALAEVDGPTLKEILDNGVKEIGGGRFVQLSGMKIEYFIDESVPPATNNGFPRGVISSVEYWQHPDHEDGTPVDLSASASYKVAMNDFMSVGGDGYPNLDARGLVYSLQDPLEIPVERYLLENSPVNPQVEGRITEVDAPPPAPVEVKLLATNDFHGRLKPPSGGLGGAAFLATHLDAIRAENPGALYVDAGDLVGATPVLSNLFYDEPTVEVMNLLGLDVQTVGNHEFDRGQSDVLRRRDGGCFGDDCDYRGGTPFEGQDFVTLSSNVVYTESGEALTLDRYVVEVDGIDVGFVGVTTKNTPNVVKPTGIEGLTFLDEAEAVNATVEDLEADGADVIVVLMHEGARQNVANPDPNECVDLSGAAVNIIDGFSDAVDVVVTGHTHQSYVCDLEDGPLVTQAFEYGKRFTEITLEVDALTGEVLTREAVNHDVTQDVEPDADVLALIAHYDELAGPALREVVGTSQVPIPRTTRLRESAQGNLATDALVDQYEEIDFAFQNSGGLRADLTRPAEAVDPPQLDGDGNYNIARENVLAVWPFGNIVALAEVDGPTLKEILDNGVKEIGGGRFVQLSGMKIEYFIDESVPPATNNGFPRGVISSVEYWQHPDHEDGTPVDLSASASYKVAMNDFMSVGGDGYPNLDARGLVYSLQDPLEIPVERYLLENSPVNPQVEGRITEVDEPVTPEVPADYRTSAFIRYATAAGWQTHVTGDLTGDGRDDLLSYHPQRGRWWITSWDENTSRYVTKLFTTYATTSGWETHLTGDVIPGNGRDELLSYHPSRGRWWVTSWNPDTSAWETSLLTTYATTTGWQTHLAGDITGSGADDLLSYHPKRGRWWVTTWDDDTDRWETFLLTTYVTPDGWQTHLAGDFSGDGFADLLSYHPNRGRWWITTFDEDADDFVTELYTTYGTTSGWAAHVSGDVTGNGMDDILSYHPNRGRWWLTSWDDDAGKLVTELFTTYVTTTGWEAHLTGDMTGNGRADLLSYYPNGRWSITTDVNDPGPS